jgi:hypothetical protein
MVVNQIRLETGYPVLLSSIISQGKEKLVTVAMFRFFLCASVSSFTPSISPLLSLGFGALRSVSQAVF